MSDEQVRLQCTHCQLWSVITGYIFDPPVRYLPRPQCQPNQAYCTAGEALLILCAGLWARAQACNQNRKKKKITWSYGFEARLRAAM